MSANAPRHNVKVGEYLTIEGLYFGKPPVTLRVNWAHPEALIMSGVDESGVEHNFFAPEDRRLPDPSVEENAKFFAEGRA